MLEAISPNQKFRYKEEDEEEKNWGHNIFYFILLMICIFIILYFNCKFCIIDFFLKLPFVLWSRTYQKREMQIK